MADGRAGETTPKLELGLAVAKCSRWRIQRVQGQKLITNPHRHSIPLNTAAGQKVFPVWQVNFCSLCNKSICTVNSRSLCPAQIILRCILGLPAEKQRKAARRSRAARTLHLNDRRPEELSA